MLAKTLPSLLLIIIITTLWRVQAAVVTLPLASIQYTREASVPAFLLTNDIKSDNLLLQRRRQQQQQVSRHSSSVVKNSQPIDQNGSDISYFVDISIGTETAQNFSVVVDTGSYDLWVYSSECTNLSCLTHNRLDVDSVQVDQDSVFTINYGQGSVSGVSTVDSVQVAGYNVTTGFGLATSVANSFNAFPIDGILGLAASSKQLNGHDSLITELKDQGFISNEVFGIDLGIAGDSSSGSISFGGADPDRFTGDIAYADLTRTGGLWMIDIDDAYVNGAGVGFTDKVALIDTGTTLILIPPEDASRIHADLVSDGGSGSGVVLTDGKNFVIPCNTSATLAFGFAGRQWQVPADAYIGSKYDDAGNCVTNIQGMAITGNNTWLMGASFLKNVYCVFDREQGRVGFADKSSSSSSSAADGSESSAVQIFTTVESSFASSTDFIITTATTFSSSLPSSLSSALSSSILSSYSSSNSQSLDSSAGASLTFSSTSTSFSGLNTTSTGKAHSTLSRKLTSSSLTSTSSLSTTITIFSSATPSDATTSSSLSSSTAAAAAVTTVGSTTSAATRTVPGLIQY
ncbi:aspartic peptidase domain-containing protein [Lipomyces japonicus]|uniref:aspartic peptidase domain-containing protein n=1 Tax=Lipomyces japonicus TaxID=56871 RepID=UPI0034CEE177